jgi:thioredoxin 1
MAEIKKINSLEEYDEFVNAPDTLNIVKVGASFCGPCRTLEQTIRELAPEEVSGVLLGEIDADDEWAEDKIAELKIRGIPVMLAFKGGEEKERVQGGMTKVALIEFIERNK